MEIPQQINVNTYKWMVNNWEQRDGKIEFKDEGGQTMKTVYFNKAYCVNYRQQVSTTGSQSLTTWLMISAGKVVFNDIELDNNWVRN